MRRRTIWLAPLLTISLAGCALRGVSRSPATEATRALEVHRGWWTALATSDAGYLRTHSLPQLVVTSSSGQSHDLDSLVASGGTARGTPKLACTGEAIHHHDAETALVTSECTGSSGQFSTTYRFLSFLRNSAEGWKVAAAQSTARAAFTARVEPAASLDELAGSYRTPRGLALEVRKGGDSLTLREPSGLELRLEPIGPNLFEADYVAPGGWITRYSFDRDANGRVVSLSVLSPGAVNTFPRN